MSETCSRIPGGSWLCTRTKQLHRGVGAVVQGEAEPEHPQTAQVEQRDLDFLPAARWWRQGNEQVSDGNERSCKKASAVPACSRVQLAAALQPIS